MYVCSVLEPTPDMYRYVYAVQYVLELIWTPYDYIL